MRWDLTIEEYSFTIKYCIGTDNKTADTVSRYVTEKKEETHFSNDKDFKLLHIQYEANDAVKQLLQNSAEEIKIQSSMK